MCVYDEWKVHPALNDVPHLPARRRLWRINVLQCNMAINMTFIDFDFRIDCELDWHMPIEFASQILLNYSGIVVSYLRKYNSVHACNLHSYWEWVESNYYEKINYWWSFLARSRSCSAFNNFAFVMFGNFRSRAWWELLCIFLFWLGDSIQREAPSELVKCYKKYSVIHW